MNFSNYKNSISALTLSILFSTTFFHNNTIYSMDFDDDLDALCDSITAEDLATLRSCAPGEATAWLSILNPLNIPKLLDKSFYLKTSIPNNRNLINYPNFLLCSYQPPENHFFTIHGFYNQTSRKSFTQDQDYNPGNRIGSYLNIQNADFISVIDSGFSSLPLPPDLAPLKGINFPDVFKLIANARLEERRLGIMNHYYQQINTQTYFECKLPIFWMIRNLNFTDEEKFQIEEQFSAFNGTTFNEDEFARKHVIMDALGTGTLELSLCKKILERTTWSIDIGTSLYLPTDFHFARGLYGTYIEPKDQQPILALCDLVQNITTSPTKNPELSTIVNNYFIAALDHLSSALLQCPLGNEKSLGLGFKLAPYWNIHENLQFNAIYIFEVFLPQEHKRFFVKKLDKVPFSESFAASTLSDDDKLALLEITLTERLFPRVFQTKVLPGFIIDSTSSLQKTYKDWDFTVGYNGWYRYNETFLQIKIPQSENIDNLDIQKSVSPEAWAVKVFGKVHRLFKGPRHEMSLSLWSDITLFNNAIGNDFSLGVSYDINF